MTIFRWDADSGLKPRLTATDIDRLRDLRSLISSSKIQLAELEKNPKSNIEKIILEKTILKASQKAADKLECKLIAIQ